MRWLLGAILVCPAVALAQVGDEEDVLVEAEAEQPPTDPDPDAQPAVVDQPGEMVGEPVELEEEQDVYWKLETSTALIQYDNRDFRPLDESTRQTILDTDDATTFGFTDVLGTFAYRPVSEAVFNARLKFDVIWGQGQIGQPSGDGSRLSVYDLNIDAALLDLDAIGIGLRFGRQPFSIGGVPRDYMLAGTVDAITARVDLRGAGRFRVLAAEIFSGHDLPELGHLEYIDGYSPTEGFRGDHYTLRTGLVYELDDEAQPDLPIEARAYWFYASIAGGGIEDSGADQVRGGKNGNFSDRDYQNLMGVRAAYVRDFERGGHVRLYAEFARSMGIDRKAKEARDVDTSGNAFGGGVDIEWAANDAVALIGGAEFYRFDGSNYASDGLEFERGFVGMKGARVGGRTVGRTSAWRPSSHLHARGIAYRPHDIQRVAGTQFAFARLGVDVYGTRLTVDYWLLSDTGSTFLDVDAIDDLPEPPFSYTREEFEAQERLGLDLGQAVDLRLVQPVAGIVELMVGYSMFLPDAFYRVEVDRINGRIDASLGGQETFWLFDLGARASF